MTESSRTEWEQLGLSDLVHLNGYSKEKLLSGGYQVQFHALATHWVEPIGPAIPDARYVHFPKINFLLKTQYLDIGDSLNGTATDIIQLMFPPAVAPPLE